MISILGQPKAVTHAILVKVLVKIYNNLYKCGPNMLTLTMNEKLTEVCVHLKIGVSNTDIGLQLITKTRLFKYTENFITKN